MIAQRINAERVALFGWGRAILLQLAHPLVAAGVADHSSFSEGPIVAARRLHGTVHAMLALSFGTPAEQARAIAGIRAIHDRVHGTLRETTGVFPAGRVYSAHDPDLLLWVHATLIESVVIVYDALVAPLGERDRDTYCAEAAGVAVALGARPEAVPPTWAGIGRYLDGMYASGRIAVGADARRLATVVLSPPLAALAWPVAGWNRVVTTGLLPADVRRQYGFAWTDRDRKRFQRAVARLRRLRRALPRRLAWWPEARTRPSPGICDL